MKPLTHPLVSRPCHWINALPILLALALSIPPAMAADPVAQVKGMDQASLLLEERGRDLVAHHPDTPRVPASTMKLLTAFAALETWGREYRFLTDVHRDDANGLWVKGYADPYLVSEELDRMVAALKSKGLREVAGIGIDDSFFGPDVEIAGRSSSDNPYDAPVTALAANFNTLNLVRTGDQVHSAEPQTPLTATARRFGLAGAAGKQRVNLREREVALRYFGELLAAKLEQTGVRVGDQRKIAPMPRHAKRFYRHANSRTLVEIVEPMLKFSNNFIANSLFLRLADPEGNTGVSMASARLKMTDFARRRFGWREFRIEDGAGLSRGNRLSARQLVELLDAFAPYRDLLSEQDGNPNVRAKTGTLRGVSCYAGYVRRESAWLPFALLINQPVEYTLRQRVASNLAR
ncbi:D-alanyl-D-alanine carboxypeptidase/D-alanyl-D-alanine-endopeptidase [Thiocystis violascens]|uniref:D-alanyl-D-alanine carboxypeptidase (Penicillin-binding protein 4) n=1 Tax=Thiocystis violascens (strain ATCC 17096 / DSM 198 / 6111) TaxID=765911 RepID=I3YA62_THIV6|nr:D-alanyl-D-alanine carboxypeptidase [Thiocystis violascens]AFL73880.1 D-alanyl-D-alanine carboxypeptidase (penicillin-binding protein 4) [Thiocystis violascens DSM 198]